MNVQKEISLRNAISYCIENNDVNTATNRIMEFIRDEKEAINFTDSSLQLTSKNKSFLDVNTIADLRAMRPNESNYGISVFAGFEHFYINGEEVLKRALIV